MARMATDRKLEWSWENPLRRVFYCLRFAVGLFAFSQPLLQLGAGKAHAADAHVRQRINTQ